MATKAGPAPLLIIDTREPKSMQLDAQVALADVPYDLSFMALDKGDFVIRDNCSPPCTVAIERKTVSDFLSSFGSGRLETQLAGLRAQYTYPILLIEGGLEIGANRCIVTSHHRQTRWSHASAQMYLWSLQRTTGVSVLHTENRTGTADVVRALVRRASLGCIGHRSVGHLDASASEDELLVLPA